MKQFCLVLAFLALHLMAYGQDFYSYYQSRRQFYQPGANIAHKTTRYSLNPP